MNRSSSLSLCALFMAACASPAMPRFPSGPVGPVGPVGAAEAATAAPQAGEPKPKAGGTAVVFGAGITRSPDAHLLAASADFPLAELFTWGPAVHVGVDDDRTLVAPMVQFKRFFPIDSTKEFASRLLPFAQAAAGVAFLEADPDGPGPEADDEGLLIGIGGGIRYAFNDRISIGTQVQFNFLPGDVLDEDMYTTWEIAQLVLTF
jgi:hypothetical protein